MQIISQLLERKVVPIAIVTLLTVLTLGTSAMGVAKVAGSFSQKDSDTTRVLGAEISKQESVETISISDQEKEDQGSVKSTNSGKPSGSSKPISNTNSSQVKPVNTIAPSTNGVVSTGSITPSPSTNSNACIITIFGKQYDVTSLRTTHSGGDVFACGTDQSATYQSKHGTSVARLASYLVTPGTQPGTTSSGSSVTPGSQSSSGSVQSAVSGSRRIGDDRDDDDSGSHREDDDSDDDSEIHQEED
jgi:hypothetical protein